MDQGSGVDSLDELKSSRSVCGKNFPNFEMLDAKIASALNKIIQNSQFKKKVSLEEQKAQKEDRLLRGRQIAFMIYDYFREHSVCTHFPKDPNCEICLKTKITRVSCRKRTGTVVPRAENFGDFITAEHKVLSEENESRNNHRCRGGTRLGNPVVTVVPLQNKNFSRDPQEPNEFPGASKETKKSLTLSFGKSCEGLSWNHCTSTPHRSETNVIAEGAVRRIKEETSAVLLQSGLDFEWWADSMECHCYLRNIQDKLSVRKTPYERRFGMPFNGPAIPFGAMVEYHPTSAKDQSRLHQFGSKVSFSAMHHTREESGKET